MPTLRSLQPTNLLQLQQTIGNGQVQRWLHSRPQSPVPAVQRTPPTVPATDADRREYIQDTIFFLNESAAFYSNERATLDQTLFETLINNWYLMVVDRERMITDQLGGDALLSRQLREAYTSAIRVLMRRASTLFGRSEGELYRENSGRIPMWAWRTPHHRELGISTPIAAGRSADPLTGDVDFNANGFQIKIAPDGADPSLGNGAKTKIQFQWGNIQWQSENGQISSFTGPGTPSVHIQTDYGPGVSAASPSGYGRGTTPEDIVGGQQTPESTSLGFHEGHHGLDYVEFLESNPPPQFTGTVGMTVAQFQTAMTEYQTACSAYAERIEAFSVGRTDCVGTTIDQFNLANADPDTEVELECTP